MHAKRKGITWPLLKQAHLRCGRWKVGGHSEVPEGTGEVNTSIGKDEACPNYPYIGLSNAYLVASRLVCKDMQNSLVPGSESSRYEYPSQCRGLDSEGSQRTWKPLYLRGSGAITKCHVVEWGHLKGWRRCLSAMISCGVRVASRSRGSWIEIPCSVFSPFPISFLFCNFCSITFPLSSTTANPWMSLGMAHSYSTTENAWFGACYLWHFLVSRLTVDLRTRNSNLWGWASEIESRLLQKCASWRTHDFTTD